MHTRVLILLAALAAGCTTSETAQRDSVTANVGVYDSAPPGWKRLRVGVPRFKIDRASVAVQDDLTREAADQLVTLADNTDRFVMIERAQLDQLLLEQGLTKIVDPDQMARVGKIQGVDYLFIGRVTNFRVKIARSGGGLGVNAGGFGLRGAGNGSLNLGSKNVSITAECGVDLRLVDPTDGTVLASSFSEYQKTDSVGAMGVNVLGLRSSGAADLDIDQDSCGKILRLALDDAVRKILPKVDKRVPERP